jgi:hypothetical protein
MEYKKAIDVLIKLLGKHRLGGEDKEAVLTAIGVLDWAALGKNRIKGIIKSRKEKLAKSIE